MRTRPSSNAEWQFWGSTDPLYAVATLAGRDRNGPNPWTLDELRASGARYFVGVHRQWKRYGIGSEHCVEIGCGAGRITAQLSRHFGRVTAVDVSPHQLEMARRLLGADLERVALALVDEPRLPVPDSSCDGVFTCEVFQHLESNEPVLAYLREAFRVLKSGGTLCFQVPVRGLHPRSLLASSARNRLLRLLRAFGRRRMMIYRQFDAHQLLSALLEIGFTDPELNVSYNREHRGFEAFFLARKA